MTEFAWLIEAPGPNYLAARKVTTSYDFVWNTDANSAIRFYSEQQADMTMMAIRQLSPHLFGFECTVGNAKATEHGWLTEPYSETARKRDAVIVARMGDAEPF
jgi:NDP-sugar pyrophosphorylase family protein